MQQKPFVSVIMGVYNQRDEEVLHAAVDSILHQSYRDFEFIIWDDGSDEKAAAMLKELEGTDERIVLAGKEENRGLAFSLNECIRLAKGKYIARMDADDISLPERFEKQVAFLEKHTEYGWCGTAADLFDGEGIWGYRPMPEEPKEKDFYYYSPYIHPSVMFRAEIFDEDRGYLETEETLRCEDYEIFMHLTQRGLKGYNLPEKLFQYRETRDSYRKRKFCFRINEAKTRYRNYKDMGLLFPFGWAFVLRPLIGGMLPAPVIGMVKRLEGRIRMVRAEEKADEQRNSVQETYPILQEYSQRSTTVPYSPGRVS